MTDRWLQLNWNELGLVPVIFIMILGLMYLVRSLSDRFGFSAEIKRKMIHVAVGLASLFFPLFFSSPLPVLVLIVCAILFMLAIRRKKSKEDGLGSVLHSVSRRSYGEIYLALAVAILFFRSEASPVLYVLPLLVITLSDTASALVGTAYGRVRFAVEDGTKSLEGALAFFTVTWICAMIVLLLMSDAARINVIILSFLIAAFCTLIEADSWQGLDNLFVPIGAHLILERYMDTAPWNLLLVALFFMVMIFLASRGATYLGITKHEARSRTILIFLILTVTQPMNSVLAFVAIFSHTLASKFTPCDSQSPVLNLIAVSAGVGLVWLVAGEVIGVTAINLFNMTFAGVAAIFMTLALFERARGEYWRFAILPFNLLLMVIFIVVAHMNPEKSIWFHPVWFFILISIGLASIVAWSKPVWFVQWRCLKAFGFAMIVPLILFFTHGVIR